MGPNNHQVNYLDVRQENFKMKFLNSKNRKGIFFTIAIILLIIPLIFLVSFYVGTSKTKVEDTVAKIRCDELHYFVQDVKKDLSRAVVIFGRRAAIYSIDYVVATPGNPLLNYTFDCSPLCGVDCNKIIYPEIGSEAAIAELSLCGTLNRSNVTYMVNHTLREWIDRIEMRGEDMNFRVNITLKEIKVIPIDAWSFSIIVDNKIDIIDKTGICYYRESTMRTISNTSIIGLEDPLYTLSSEGKIMKYIYDCDIVFDLRNVAGCSLEDRGNGSGQGYVIFYSDIENETLTTYCTDNDGYVSDKIIVFDKAFGNCNSFESSCFNSSSVYHFAGVIDYAKNALESFIKKCNVNIPWVSATGTLDNESSYGLARDPNCADANITQGGCVYIKNTETLHQVIIGINSNNLNFSCYQISNITNEENCSENYSNGPSFFDRLDGTYNLSEKYQNQSKKYFNNSLIGIETLVDPYELMDHGIIPYQNATWIDYLYWKNINGSEVCGVCSKGAFTLRLDCQHIEIYDLSIC